MLAIARSLAPELVRGLSTSLALLANQRDCPDSTCAPIVHCAAVPRQSDCVCQGSQRQCPTVENHPDQLAYLAIAFLAGTIVGIVVCVVGAAYFGFISRPLITPPRSTVPFSSAVEDSPAVATSPAAIALQRLKDSRR